MAKAAIIVESPTKTKTLERFLGGEYKLLASMGHVRDLPGTGLAVDVDEDFEPHYTTDSRQKKVLSDLRKGLKNVEKVYLASDPDREGEAIAWHLAEALKLTGAERIEFNEITEPAVREALAHPRQIDLDRVNAQQARRILDRLVGYLISPILWEKFSTRGRGRTSLSAGRVQSAALRLICEREREIAAFNPVEYWSVTAKLSPEGREEPFEAELKTKGGEELELSKAEQVEPIVEQLRDEQYKVSAIERKERRRNPQPPFITSTLQRAAANELHFSARKTMLVAQELYQGIELAEGTVGLITYMRTDSTRVAAQARDAAVEMIRQVHGEEYVGPGATGKKAKGAQDAHEAIRPSYVEHRPDAIRSALSKDQFALYDLIWRRFMASQMSSAVFDQTALQIDAGEYGFRATGSVLKFAGFLSVLKPKKDAEENSLPKLEEGEILTLLDVAGEQHFTKPPPRYNEATLVAALEANGVGRPSTYAQIIETLRQRKYVNMQQRQFFTTATGLVVNDWLVENFPEIIDVDFTARVEADLDSVEQGSSDWVGLLKSFYSSFKERLDEAHESPRKKIMEGEKCPECGGQLYETYSIYGKFAGCEKYPECKYTRDLMGDVLPKPEVKSTGEECPECGKELLVRSGRRGQEFIGCSGYPDCRYTRPMKGDGKPKRQAIETDIECDRCEKNKLMVRFGRRGAFLGCGGYPKCRNTRNLTDEEREKYLPAEDEEAPEDDSSDESASASEE